MSAASPPPLPPRNAASPLASASASAALSPVRGVTFDLDDTLWCGASVIRRASHSFHSFLAARTPLLAAAFPPERFNGVLMQLQREFPQQAHDYTFLRKHALRQCLAQVSEPQLSPADSASVEAFVDEAFQAFLIPRSEPEFFDGVELLLQTLREELLPLTETVAGSEDPTPLMGVITNGNCAFERLPSFFHTHMDFLVSAEGVGVAKPEPLIFDAAAKHFSVSRDQIVHVGDHYHADVVGAKRAGMRTIWIDAKRQKPDALHRDAMDADDAAQFAEADAIVTHVRAVADVVRLWNRLVTEST